MYTQKMDIDNIFSLFSKEENLEGVNENVYVDFTQTPIYWLGMYKKLVLNHINFNKKVLKFFKDANQELDVDDMKEAGEFVIYNRAWSYAQNINPEHPDTLLAIDQYCDEYLDTALKLGINFFEQHEEYEKCALLLKLLKHSESFQS